MIETLNLASLVETIWTKDSKQWIVSGIKINGPKYVRPHIIDKMANVTAPGGYRVQLNFTRGFAKHRWHVAVTEFVESILCYLKKRGDRIPGSLLAEAMVKAWPEPADTEQPSLTCSHIATQPTASAQCSCTLDLSSWPWAFPHDSPRTWAFLSTPTKWI